MSLILILAVFAACAAGQGWTSTNYYTSSSCSGNPAVIYGMSSSVECTPVACNDVEYPYSVSCTTGSSFTTPAGSSYVVYATGGSASTCAGPTTTIAVEANGTCFEADLIYYYASCTGGKISYKQCSDPACSTCDLEITESGCNNGGHVFCSDAHKVAIYFLSTIIIALVAIALAD